MRFSKQNEHVQYFCLHTKVLLGLRLVAFTVVKIFALHDLAMGRDKTRIRMRMADTDVDEKIRMRKCGWRIKRG